MPKILDRPVSDYLSEKRIGKRKILYTTETEPDSGRVGAAGALHFMAFEENGFLLPDGV
jgi:hypothetical protein